MFYLIQFSGHVILSDVEGSGRIAISADNGFLDFARNDGLNLSAKSVQSRYIAPDDQSVNVMCAFVREDAL
jgi:hypothetical protein